VTPKPVKTVRIYTHGGAELVVLLSQVDDDHHVDLYPGNPDMPEDKIHKLVLLGLIQLAMEKPGKRIDVLLDPLLGVASGGSSVH